MDYGKYALKELEELKAELLIKERKRESQKNSVFFENDGINLSTGETYGKKVVFLSKTKGDTEVKVRAVFNGRGKTEVYLDGKKVWEDSIGGTYEKQRKCYGIVSGEHTLEIKIVALSAINAGYIKIEVAGKIAEADGYVFVDGDETGKFFIEKNFSYLYGALRSGGVNDYTFELHGIRYARVKKFGTGYLLFLVSEAGICMVVKVGSDGLISKSLTVTDGVTCADGCVNGGGGIALFACKRDKTEYYLIDDALSVIKKCAEAYVGGEEISVCTLNNRIYLTSTSGGGVFLSALDEFTCIAADVFSIGGEGA